MDSKRFGVDKKELDAILEVMKRGPVKALDSLRKELYEKKENPFAKKTDPVGKEDDDVDNDGDSDESDKYLKNRRKAIKKKAKKKDDCDSESEDKDEKFKGEKEKIELDPKLAESAASDRINAAAAARKRIRIARPVEAPAQTIRDKQDAMRKRHANEEVEMTESSPGREPRSVWPKTKTRPEDFPENQPKGSTKDYFKKWRSPTARIGNMRAHNLAVAAAKKTKDGDGKPWKHDSGWKKNEEVEQMDEGLKQINSKAFHVLHHKTGKPIGHIRYVGRGYGWHAEHTGSGMAHRLIDTKKEAEKMVRDQHAELHNEEVETSEGFGEPTNRITDSKPDFGGSADERLRMYKHYSDKQGMYKKATARLRAKEAAARKRLVKNSRMEEVEQVDENIDKTAETLEKHFKGGMNDRFRSALQMASTGHLKKLHGFNMGYSGASDHPITPHIKKELEKRKNAGK